MSQNSYLREFCAQVSQIVFLADLTVLRLITILWAEISRDSYLREFCAQVSEILFKLIWPFYRLIELYHEKCHKTLFSASSVQNYQKSSS